MDDIFAIFEGNEADVSNFLTFLNNLHPQINFTYKLEVRVSLPFPDINISKIDNKLSFEVYRKPTTTSHVIPFHSRHPTSHKLSSFNSLFFRLFRLSLSPQGFQKELYTIHRIAHENGYPKDVIHKTFKKCKKKVFLKHLTSLSAESFKSNGFFSIPYVPYLSDRLKQIFLRYDINLSSSVRGTLKSILSTDASNVEQLSKSGVYRMTCSCGKCYVGRTFRNFKTRYLEHTRYLKTNRYYDMDTVKLRSTFAHHVLLNKCQYNPTDKNIEVLHTICSNNIIAQLECLEILAHKIKSPNTLLNEVTEFDNDKILTKLLLRPSIPLALYDSIPRH